MGRRRCRLAFGRHANRKVDPHRLLVAETETETEIDFLVTATDRQ